MGVPCNSFMIQTSVGRIEAAALVSLLDEELQAMGGFFSLDEFKLVTHHQGK